MAEYSSRFCFTMKFQLRFKFPKCSHLQHMNNTQLYKCILFVTWGLVVLQFHTSGFNHKRAMVGTLRCFVLAFQKFIKNKYQRVI